MAAWRTAIMIACWSAALVGCGSPQAARTDVPEPARSPPLTQSPAGRLVQLPAGAAPEGIVIDASTATTAVGVRHPDGVLLLDSATEAIRRRVDLLGAPRHLQLGAAGLLLAPTEGADRLYVLRTATGAVMAEHPVGRQPHDAAAAGGSYFVGDEFANTVHVIKPDGSTTIALGPRQPGGVAAATDGTAVMVIGVRGRQIEQLTAAGLVVGTAACGVGPTHVRRGPGELFYVADTEGNAILAYRAGRRGPVLVGRTATGAAPYGRAVDGTRGRLYVTLTGTNQLRSYRIDGTALRPDRRWATVRQPNDVAIDDATGAIVVAGAADDVLQIVTSSSA